MQKQQYTNANAQAQQKARRKKYRMGGYGQSSQKQPSTYAQKRQGQEQVMKAYGVPKQIGGNSNAHQQDGGQGGRQGGHRHYVKRY